jgi:hypothetical protein
MSRREDDAFKVATGIAVVSALVFAVVVSLV